MTRFVLVRHGQAVCNVERTIEGAMMCRGLSDLGRKQAAAVAERLRVDGPAFDAIVSSPIRRARETAEAIVSAIGGTITTNADFEEVRPGEAEGMSWDQYSAFYGNTEGWEPNVPFAPGAEAWTTFAARVAQGLDHLTDTYTNKTVLIVAHGGVIDASLFHYFALNPNVQSPIDFESSNTGITEWHRNTYTVSSPPTSLPGEQGGLDSSEVHRWRLVRYNDAAHLRSAIAAP